MWPFDYLIVSCFYFLDYAVFVNLYVRADREPGGKMKSESLRICKSVCCVCLSVFLSLYLSMPPVKTTQAPQRLMCVWTVYIIFEAQLDSLQVTRLLLLRHFVVQDTQLLPHAVPSASKLVLMHSCAKRFVLFCQGVFLSSSWLCLFWQDLSECVVYLPASFPLNTWTSHVFIPLLLHYMVFPAQCCTLYFKLATGRLSKMLLKACRWCLLP